MEVRLQNLRPSRRWLRFSLRGAFIATTMFSIWFGFLVSEHRRQQKVVAAVERAGGSVFWDYQVDTSRDWRAFSPPNSSPPSPKWLRYVAGDTFLAKVERVYIDDFPIQDDDLAAFEGATSIRWLVIGNGKAITGRGFKHLAPLKDLDFLMLSGASIGDSDLVHLRGMEHLKRLHLDGTHITDAGLSDLQELTELESLVLPGSVTRAGVQAFLMQVPKCKVVIAR